MPENQNASKVDVFECQQVIKQHWLSPQLIIFITYGLWPTIASSPAIVGMDVRRRVGINLQRLRREKGFSQEELAHCANVHQTYLSGVEGGKRNPSIQVLQRLMQALGIDIEELFRRPRGDKK
jgi:DNA-binding XRE family transcriptional regulator